MNYLDSESFQEQNTDFDPSARIEAELASIIKKPARIESTPVSGILTVDVYQTADDVVIKSTIAGATADELDISVTNEMVTIKGSRKMEDKISAQDYYYQELYWGSFSRSIILPEEIDADNAKASLKNGVLTLKLPKLAKNKNKKLKVSS